MPETKIKKLKKKTGTRKSKKTPKVGSVPSDRASSKVGSVPSTRAKNRNLADQIQNLTQKIGSLQSQYMAQHNQNAGPSKVTYFPQYIPQPQFQSSTLEEVKKHTAPILEEIKQFSGPLLEYSKNMASSVNELKSKIPDYSKPMILPPPDQDQKSYHTEGRFGTIGPSPTEGRFGLERPNFTPPSSGLSNLGAFQSANLHYPGTSIRMDTPTIGGPGELKTQSDDSIGKEKHMTFNDPTEVAKQGIEQLGEKEAVKTVVQQTPTFENKKTEYLQLYKSIFGTDFPESLDGSDIKGLTNRINNLTEKWTNYKSLYYKVYANENVALEESNWMPKDIRQLNSWTKVMQKHS